jgi:predicted nuclease of predicted toxin-antitoxin system
VKIVADEGVERQIVDGLRNDGHLVWYVAEETPSSSDDFVLSVAREQNALLLTTDTDFGELIYRLGRTATGIVLLRLAGLPLFGKTARVVWAIKTHGDEMRNSFTVISLHSIRVRKLTQV